MEPNYFLQDGHGDNRQLANGSLVSCRYNYDAYGAVQTTNSSTTAEAATTTKLYCGEQYGSNLHMYNFRSRYYDPNSGRFNQRDSVAENKVVEITNMSTGRPNCTVEKWSGQ
jgi:RHS repeat-associated protein